MGFPLCYSFHHPHCRPLPVAFSSLHPYLRIDSDIVPTYSSPLPHKSLPCIPSFSGVPCPRQPSDLVFRSICRTIFYIFVLSRHALRSTRALVVFHLLLFFFASAFRSNGILHAGYIIWGLVVHPYINHRKISSWHVTYASFLTSIVVSPFVYHNYLAYKLFCEPSSAHRPTWCWLSFPSVYAHVQATYWDVGFLRYWSLSQIPNFLVAAPPIAILASFSAQHLVRSFQCLLGLRDFNSESSKHSPFLTHTITPHVLHTVFMSLMFVFFSHTQIALRLSAALPTLYWAVAWLFSQPTNSLLSRSGSVWLWWSITWALIALGLWAAFLPPA